MNSITAASSAAAMLLAALSGCANDASSATSPDRAGNPPEQITLTLGTNEALEDSGGLIAQRFADNVIALSDGRIVVTPTFKLPSVEVADWDQEVIDSVQAGDYDLVLARAGAWHDDGVTSLDVLQLPGIIESDEQADRLAQSGVAANLLEGLSAAQMTGLGLYPDGLRHLASLDGAPLSFDEIQGREVRAPKSATAFAVLAAIGAQPVALPAPEFTEAVFDGTLGLVDTSVARLPNQPRADDRMPWIMAANLTLYSKFDVLAAPSSVIESLGADADILREAASQTLTQTIAERPRDADQIGEACDAGAQITAVPASDIDRMIAAAQPIVDEIAAGPDAELVADVRVAAGPAPDTSFEECGPPEESADSPSSMSPSTPDTSLPPTWTPMSDLPEGAAPLPPRSEVTPDPGNLPDGVYRVRLDPVMLDAVDGPGHGPGSKETVQIYLDGGRLRVEVYSEDGERVRNYDGGVYQVAGNEVVIVQAPEGTMPGTDGVNRFTWTLEGDTLTFTQIDGKRRDVYYVLPFTRVIEAG